MGLLRAAAVVTAFAVTAAAADEPPPLGAHAIPPTAYLSYVPLDYPRIVRETPESELVQLYGDPASPGYVDVAPRDGVDDARGAHLLALAVRFSPYLVRNTTSIPMDWKQFMARPRSFPIHVDRWELATSPPSLVRREQVDLAGLAGAPCPGSDPAAAPLLDDCALTRLLREFDPDAPGNVRGHTLADGARSALFTVLYLDFPGDDPESWKREYEAEFGGRLRREYQGFKKAYVHPFVAADSRGGLELVLQYWFFYPFNDSANKHEGDWEHLNVVVTPRSRIVSSLTAQDIRAMLDRDARALDGDDPLVIRRVEYFVHGKVFTLDYGVPNVYAPRSVWQAELAAQKPERLGENEIRQIVRTRAYEDRHEQVLNTHPIAFIGGDSKGLDLLLAAPGARNRDSHATYPFRGTFTEVAPGGTTEEISNDFDLRQFTGDRASRWPENVERFDDAGLLEIVPDWERVRDLVRSEPEVRREWSWLVLPIRWGYPAVESPLAGIVSHADTGNVSPPGPAYNGGWNRVGASGGFSRYDPNRYWPVFPLSPLDTFDNRFGFLNAPVTAFTVLPPFDLLYRLVWRPLRTLLPGGLSPVYLPSAPVQRRVVGISIGGFVNYLPSSMGAMFLNSTQLPEIVDRLTAAGVTAPVHVTTTTGLSVYPSFQIQFYLTPRLVTQNTFRYSRNSISLNVVSNSAGTSALVDGTIQMYEYAGSLRLNIFTGRIQPFLKVGYGYSWYRLQGVKVNDQGIAKSTSSFLHTPSLDSFTSILPNTLHYGIGIEVSITEPATPLSGYGIGFKLESSVFTHSLGLSIRDTSELGLQIDAPVNRPNVDFAVVVSF
jgi:hypothetical protein